MAGEYTPEIVATRRALLDALDALPEQSDALIVIGAQAVFIHAGSVATAIAITTKDSDLAIDPSQLVRDPLLESALTNAGFHRDLKSPQPGIWFTTDGVEVDFLVPSSLASGGRGARIPPHHKHSTRRAKGLEASLVDNRRMTVESLDPDDARSHEVKVAGRAAVVVSKLHKINDRIIEGERIQDKDAHDIYRLMASWTDLRLAKQLVELAGNDLAGETTAEAIEIMERLFGGGPEAIGCEMAGRTEAEVGDAAGIALATSVLADGVLREMALRRWEAE